MTPTLPMTADDTPLGGEIKDFGLPDARLEKAALDLPPCPPTR